jgi:quercetin dioxygenase-like cupin family protein
MERPVAGELLRFDLRSEAGAAADPGALERSGRSARTLVKDGPLRVTLVVLQAGGRIAEHHAEGPITVQPLEGRIRFQVGDRTAEVGPGELLAVGAGVRHAVESAEGSAFLLTVAHTQAR